MSDIELSGCVFDGTLKFGSNGFHQNVKSAHFLRFHVKSSIGQGQAHPQFSRLFNNRIHNGPFKAINELPLFGDHTPSFPIKKPFLL